MYVDDMYRFSMGQYGRMKMSHMWGPDTEELHRMADAIGLQRKWFQKNASFPHYDVSMSLRTKAVAAGAKEVTIRQMVCTMMLHQRQSTAEGTTT